MIGPDIYCVQLIGGEFHNTELCVQNQLPNKIRMPRYLRHAQSGDKIPYRADIADDFIEYAKFGRDPGTTEFLYKVIA